MDIRRIALVVVGQVEPKKDGVFDSPAMINASDKRIQVDLSLHQGIIVNPAAGSAGDVGRGVESGERLAQRIKRPRGDVRTEAVQVVAGYRDRKARDAAEHKRVEQQRLDRIAADDAW